MGLLLGFDRLFVELFEVVIDDEVFVQAQAFFLAPAVGAVVERHDSAADRGVVDAQGAAGVELFVKPVFAGHLQVFLHQPQVVFVLEPFIGHFAVAEVFINLGAAVDDGDNAMLLNHCATHAAAPGPGIDIADFTILDRHRHDPAHVGLLRRRTGGQDAWIVFIAIGEHFVDAIGHRVDSGSSRFPDVLNIERNDLHLDLFTVIPVQTEH